MMTDLGRGVAPPLALAALAQHVGERQAGAERADFEKAPPRETAVLTLLFAPKSQHDLPSRREGNTTVR